MIKLTKNILDKIEEILECLNNKYSYIVLGGSNGIKYIRKNKDIDLFIFCNSDLGVEKCKELYNQHFDNCDIRYNYNLDVHIIEKQPDNFIYYLNMLWRDLAEIPQEFLDKFENKMIAPITLEEFLVDEEDLLKVIKEFITRRTKNLTDRKLYLTKYWYYIYLIYCIINSRSLDLTEEQINNVNMLHDRNEEDFEKRKELIDSMIEENK